MQKVKTLVKGLVIALSIVVLSGIALYQPDIPIEDLKLTYAPAPSQFMTIDGMEVHYRDEGIVTDTIPIVLLHGTSASLHTWEAMVQALKGEHRLLRMDLPAFGLTGPHPQHDYSINMYLNFFHQFLKQKKIDRCYLIGNSLGGLIAWQYAATYPNQVEKLILLDAAGYPRINFKGNLAFQLARIPVLKEILKVITPISLVRKSVEDVYGDKSKVSDALVKQYRDMACREGNREALVARLNFKETIDTTLITTINIPTLVIWGEKDQLILPTDAWKFKRDLPNNETYLLPGIGHLPMEEAPEKVIPFINTFLRKR